MRYKNCRNKVLNVDGNDYEIVCPEEVTEGTYPIECGTSLEVAQINGNAYGWFIGGLPLLKRETDHGIFTEDYQRLFDVLETSSFWQGEVKSGV